MKKGRNKNVRDVTKLSGKTLAETLEPSSILHIPPTEEWVTSKDLTEDNLPFIPEVMKDLTVFLLGNININSSHLFRADILYDSQGILSTPQQKELSFAQTGNGNADATADVEDHVDPIPAKKIPGFDLNRTVVRRFIPRNPNLDQPLKQTCHFYEADLAPSSHNSERQTPRLRRFLAVYTPHVASKEDIPFYHPLLRSLAYLYDFTYNTTESTEAGAGSGTLSLHFLPYQDEPIPNRLERTMLALLNTQIRLARNTRLSDNTPEGGNHKPTKDNVIPQHLVQNTYSRLKFKYAPDLCKSWVEDTEPSKHVFEDLAITAFLIELWRSMYGALPAEERNEDKQEKYNPNFPGFVDVACGNGILVYVLLMEGYEGWGFDARRRKTWKILPEFVQARLKEEIYVPKPFADAMTASGREGELSELGVKTHCGMFARDTFVISNHADELTVWTPLMATLACPESPSPFIAIPCCSHALSGAKYRYPPPKMPKASGSTKNDASQPEDTDAQPAKGDLKALRYAKQDAQTEAGFEKSMYGSLTAKTINIAEEIGYGVEKTLLRIPSTRNMAVLGGRKRVTEEWRARTQKLAGVASTTVESAVDKAMTAVHRECSRDGGVEAAAKIWIERAKGIHKGQGSGNQRGH
ncbi:DUF1613 domain protein [Aspergillus leporis]|uniref:tRNA (uracil-O(2)-)-methyltransferase n=1 Tax=Aspergillus leporis TaxID=41062 RepID=A0A5N5X4U6_9EURO|nr:DUF1613 domain protein [Aspergillus leporis]